MAETEQPQLYLITPPELELSRFPDQLARVLDSYEIACVRLSLASHDEDRIARLRLDPTSDGIAVPRAVGQRLEDQGVECAVQQLLVGRSHHSSMPRQSGYHLLMYT